LFKENNYKFLLLLLLLLLLLFIIIIIIININLLGMNSTTNHTAQEKLFYQSQQISALESALKKSNATWKIVTGHYPIYSVAEHGDTSEVHHIFINYLTINRPNLKNIYTIN